KILGAVLDTDAAIELYAPGNFDRMMGSCYLSLDQPARAQAILERSANAMQSRQKSTAIILGNLSLAHIRQKNLDAAVMTLHSAIDVVEAIRAGGGLTVVVKAARELTQWQRREARVDEIRDRLLTL